MPGVCEQVADLQHQAALLAHDPDLPGLDAGLALDISFVQLALPVGTRSMARHMFCRGPWSSPKLLGSQMMWVHSDCQTIGLPSDLKGADCTSPRATVVAMVVMLTLGCRSLFL